MFVANRFIGWFRKNIELTFWLTALVLLYYMPLEGAHYSLCVPSILGFESCPGCGLGHAVHLFLHGEIQHAFEHHPLVIIAIPIILLRIFALIKDEITHNKLIHAK